MELGAGLITGAVIAFALALFQLHADARRDAHARRQCIQLFTSATLVGADLRGVHLEGADLWAARLGGADVRGARLGRQGEFPGGANLGHADLRGVVNLDEAELAGALADSKTEWPPDFAPEDAGVITGEVSSVYSASGSVPTTPS